MVRASAHRVCASPVPSSATEMGSAHASSAGPLFTLPLPFVHTILVSGRVEPRWEDGWRGSPRVGAQHSELWDGPQHMGSVHPPDHQLFCGGGCTRLVVPRPSLYPRLALEGTPRYVLWAGSQRMGNVHLFLHTLSCVIEGLHTPCLLGLSPRTPCGGHSPTSTQHVHHRCCSTMIVTVLTAVRVVGSLQGDVLSCQSLPDLTGCCPHAPCASSVAFNMAD